MQNISAVSIYMNFLCQCTRISTIFPVCRNFGVSRSGCLFSLVWYACVQRNPSTYAYNTYSDWSVPFSGSEQMKILVTFFEDIQRHASFGAFYPRTNRFCIQFYPDSLLHVRSSWRKRYSAHTKQTKKKQNSATLYFLFYFFYFFLHTNIAFIHPWLYSMCELWSGVYQQNDSVLSISVHTYPYATFYSPCINEQIWRMCVRSSMQAHRSPLSGGIGTKSLPPPLAWQ